MENKFNKEFEDFGWANMQKLLDRDMPVKEKKRRGLVFWLFLMGGLVVCSGTFFYLNNKKEVPNSRVNNSELNNNAFNNNANKIELNKGNKGLNKPELNTKNAQLNSVIKSFKLNNSQLNKGVINSELINKNKELNTLEFNNYAAQTSNISGQIKSNIPERTTVKVAPTNDVGVTFTVALVKVHVETPPQYLGEKTSDKNDGVDTLPKRKVGFEETLPLTTNNLGINNGSDTLEMKAASCHSGYIEMMMMTTKLKTHFGITTGVHTEGGQKIEGWQIGLMANKYLRRNWAIYAGLNYRKTMVQVDSLSDLNLGYITAGGTSTTTPTVGANSSLIPVKKIILKELNYLELPVGVNYNFNKKWSVLAGIKMAYLMSPNVGISADSTVFFLKNVSSKQANYALDQSNSVAALGLQRWDMAAIGGINYTINDKISLSLRYDYGFKNVLNRANWAAYNRFIGFNAVYYFR